MNAQQEVLRATNEEIRRVTLGRRRLRGTPLMPGVIADSARLFPAGCSGELIPACVVGHTSRARRLWWHSRSRAHP
jgi:hypothetical protein